METAHDPFVEGAPPAEGDPFEGVEPDTTDPAAEVATATEEPPVVDREGQPVEEPAPAAEEPPAPPQPEPEPEPAPEPSPAADEPPAPPAPEPAGSDASSGTGGKKKESKGEMRHYKVMFQTAQHAWAEHPLKDVPQGVKVVTADGEKWVEARNNDHATRIAFAILGSPADGATVWPVPKGAFKPKRVKPKPPAPERTRLDIS